MSGFLEVTEYENIRRDLRAGDLNYFGLNKKIIGIENGDMCVQRVLSSV